MGNGMATLARATALADRYGTADYGAIAGVAGGVTTASRALAPVAAALYAAALGLPALFWTLALVAALAAWLAHDAERPRRRPARARRRAPVPEACRP